MNDEDREAFEAWAKTRWYGDGTTGSHDYHAYSIAETVWQAARDHYAPKVTEKEAEQLCDQALRMAERPADVIEALKAAGVRFKEEP